MWTAARKSLDDGQCLQSLRGTKWFGLVCIALSLGLCQQVSAHAEWYAAGQLGLALPGTLGDSTITSPTLGGMGGVTGARVSDLDLNNSILFGGKVGYFGTNNPWLGGEAEVFTTRPSIPQQTIVGGVPGRPFADTLQGTSLYLTAVALNLIIREPSLSEHFQPYGGIGPALFLATYRSGGTTGTTVNPGVNFVAGARYFLTSQLAVFGEFKYDLVTLKFNGIQGDYSAQVFAFGLSYHWGERSSSAVADFRTFLLTEPDLTCLVLIPA